MTQTKPSPGGLFADPRKALTLLLALGLAIRLGMLLACQPVLRWDSLTYAKLALQIARWDFHDYTDARTPTYPLFMLLCGMNYRLITIAQSALGLAITAMLF